MNKTTQSIIDRVQFITKDYSAVRWTMKEMSDWINDAQTQIAQLVPPSASQYMVLTLAEGARQDLRVIDPDTRWVRLMELLCNVNTTSGVDKPTGATIRLVSRPILDSAFPSWRSVTPTARAVAEYAMDAGNEFVFDVNPPVVAGTKVYAQASVIPAPVAVLNSGKTALDDPNELFGLPDGYDIAAVDYVVFRAFNKNANDQTYAAQASAHLQLFQAALGGQAKAAS
ncbi:phage adaptor protein [Candidimonas nitroreducens]|uniref:Uncharacterized protein n=1 Tax=Candidimonas nitroreducens TaxID=683354 RepID=A0A225M1T6_9BURK|nr:DUF6682 family protein [Candidimonas nitroreducens]OWT55278.1 hypothetical protein CEY11_21450 [Candidimonas nitroreducens]